MFLNDLAHFLDRRRLDAAFDPVDIDEFLELLLVVFAFHRDLATGRTGQSRRPALIGQQALSGFLGLRQSLEGTRQ